MKLKKLQQEFHNNLEDIFLKEEIDNFFFMLTDYHFNLKRLDLALNPRMEVVDNKVIWDGLEALKKEIPIQYILGETEFYGLKFKVNQHTLIPRPETEELADWIIKDVDISDTDFNILDIGTGSGCIAISLAKSLVSSKVYALDVSKEALDITKINAERNQVDLVTIKNDILNKASWDLEFRNLNFDIIVSNPPYVRQLEKNEMKSNVLDHEPHIALFVDDNDPLLFYRYIMDLSKEYLRDNGKVFFEINENLGQEMIDLVKSYDFKVTIRQDIYGKDRMIKAIKN